MRTRIVMIILCLFSALVSCKTDYEINIEGQKTDKDYTLKKVDGKRVIDVKNKEEK